MINRKSNNGISLLELLLVIALIGVITVLSVRYFVVVNSNLQVTRGVEVINRITRASYEWLTDNRYPNFANPEITLSQLLNENLLAAADAHNPWGGEVMVRPGRNTRYVQVTLTAVPMPACQSLAKQVRTINHVVTPACFGMTFQGEF